MKDPLPQKDNPYAGLVAPKRQPLIQDMSDMKTFLKCWLSSKKGQYLCPKPPQIHKPTNSIYDHKSANIHKKPKIERKDKNGVPLCPGMAVI